MSFCPTSVEPVNESLRMRPSAISGPVALPVDFVVTTLSTPSGSPAAARICGQS